MSKTPLHPLAAAIQRDRDDQKLTAMFRDEAVPLGVIAVLDALSRYVTRGTSGN